jgi:[FeFe] hydrogenase H-cluster maturation GTPase HydF
MKGMKSIGIFGKRNVGKSSLINLLLGQDFAIVSGTPGTTTDPVRKRMEIHGVGPVSLIDTAGIDDDGELGKKRIGKTLDIIDQIDTAILMFSGNVFAKEERDLMKLFRDAGLPVLLIHNQSDIIPLDPKLAQELNEKYAVDVMEFSCSLLDEEEQKEAVENLYSLIGKCLLMDDDAEKPILRGLVKAGETAILVCPMDSEAPKGRLILPEVMGIRDVLDNNAIAVVVQPSELKQALEMIPHVALVATDSQAFKQIAPLVPQDIALTSFSILLARSKGAFDTYVEGISHIGSLKDGDRVLMLESCTHHPTCEDIGHVKIPKMLQEYTGKRLEFVYSASLDDLPDLSTIAFAIQCGGCMVTRRQLLNRVKKIVRAGIPVANYGMTISYVTGIYKRAISPVCR